MENHIFQKFPIRFFTLIAVFSVPLFNTLFAQSLEERLIVKVAHIEEFIDRFNYDEGSYFHNYVENNYADQEIGRSVIIESLFNQRDNLQSRRISRDFITEVCNQDRPAKLDFNDAMWYATVPLTIHTKTKEFSAILTLEIQLNQDYSTEWVIAGAQSVLLPVPEEEITFFIKPSSHATYFPELRDVATSTSRLKEVVSERHAYSSLLRFEKLLEHNAITSISISSNITYHFLQISGWIMKVSNFNQDDELNSGWLISDLLKVTSLEMRKYEKDILGVR